MRFSELLAAVAGVAGIRRVRFTTSHPRDFGEDIVKVIEAVPGICEHVHLRVQSGSTNVLRAMARTYTREEYLEKIALLHGSKRAISITTDLIVGFPGETEKDFEETLSLLDVVQYRRCIFVQVLAETEYAVVEDGRRDSGRREVAAAGDLDRQAERDSAGAE